MRSRCLYGTNNEPVIFFLGDPSVPVSRFITNRAFCDTVILCLGDLSWHAPQFQPISRPSIKIVKFFIKLEIHLLIHVNVRSINRTSTSFIFISSVRHRQQFRDLPYKLFKLFYERRNHDLFIEHWYEFKIISRNSSENPSMNRNTVFTGNMPKMAKMRSVSA